MTETDRQRGRQTKKQTDRDRETDRQTERQRHRERQRQADRQRQRERIAFFIDEGNIQVCMLFYIQPSPKQGTIIGPKYTCAYFLSYDTLVHNGINEV